MNLYLSQQQNHLLFLLLLHRVSLPFRHVGHGPGLGVLPPVRLLPGLALLDQLSSAWTDFTCRGTCLWRAIRDT